MVYAEPLDEKPSAFARVILLPFDSLGFSFHGREIRLQVDRILPPLTFEFLDTDEFLILSDFLEEQAIPRGPVDVLRAIHDDVRRLLTR